jgi:hypothetical protein
MNIFSALWRILTIALVTHECGKVLNPRKTRDQKLSSIIYLISAPMAIIGGIILVFCLLWWLPMLATIVETIMHVFMGGAEPAKASWPYLKFVTIMTVLGVILAYVGHRLLWYTTYLDS